MSWDKIHKKAERVWQSGDPFRAELGEVELFPLLIKVPALSSHELSQDFSNHLVFFNQLKAEQKTQVGAGYTIQWKEVVSRILGKQTLPDTLSFETIDDLAHFTQKNDELAPFRLMLERTRTERPELISWINQNPFRFLKNEAAWEELLAALNFFSKNFEFLEVSREISIAGVGTKFLEQHVRLLDELLPIVSPSHFAAGQFSESLQIFQTDPLIRFRLLDLGNRSVGSFSDLSVPLSQFKIYEPKGIERVYIVENKATGLSFPEIKNSIVIFGLGRGVVMLKHVPWLSTKKIFYWGDLDTQGFAILSQFRAVFPLTESILMGRRTLLEHQDFWIKEPEESRYLGQLENLTPEELDLFTDLRNCHYGYPVRLEQERVKFNLAND